MPTSLGTPQCRATSKLRRLIIAVAAVAKKAEQQYNDGENCDQYHERPNSGKWGLSAPRAPHKQVHPGALASRKFHFTREKFPTFFERGSLAVIWISESDDSRFDLSTK